MANSGASRTARTPSARVTDLVIEALLRTTRRSDTATRFATATGYSTVTGVVTVRLMPSGLTWTTWDMVPALLSVQAGTDDQ